LSDGAWALTVRSAAGKSRIGKIVSIIGGSKRFKADIQDRVEGLAGFIAPADFAGTVLIFALQGKVTGTAAF
jgi:hypothetical protein